MKELSYLNKYLRKYKYYFSLGILFTIITNVFQIIPAQMVRHSLDLIIENIDLYRNYGGLKLQDSYYEIFVKYVIIYATIILAMALLRGFFLFLVRQTLIVMSRHIEFDLKNEIYKHYQELPTSFYRRNSTGDLMNRISEDVSKVRMYLGPSIMYGLNLIILFAILIPYMLSISVKLTLFSLLPLPILSFSIYYVNNIINRRSEAIQRQQSRLSTFVQEAFSGIRVLKSFVREQESSEKFEHENSIYKDKSLRLTMVNALFFPIVMALIGLSVVLTVFVGGNEVIKGSLTFGNIAEFILYVNYLTWPVTALGWISSITQRAEASQRRINEFLKEKNDILSLKNISPEVKGTIEFRDLTFTYPDTGIVALKDINFKINQGESLAIIGTTGSGKSTVANLLCRLFDPSEGEILVDESNLKDYNIGYIRSQIGYVPQDIFLFSDTIFNNIAFGSEDINPERVMQAAKDSDLYKNIMSFPDQFNTRVGERGITLSGGQKQRVSIARAIVRDPKILILDDSLSAVDTKTENTILTSMKRFMKDRTTIIISHRVSSAKLADKIIVLDDGVIVEQGTNESLLKEDGIYRNLYEKQLQAEELLGN